MRLVGCYPSCGFMFCVKLFVFNAASLTLLQVLSLDPGSA